MHFDRQTSVGAVLLLYKLPKLLGTKVTLNKIPIFTFHIYKGKQHATTNAIDKRGGRFRLGQYH